MHGAGNDFILIDDRNMRFSTADNLWIKQVCSPHNGIGAEGLILLQPSEEASFLMRFFNPDGSEADMCGNGLRCAARLAYDLGIVEKKMTIKTRAGILKAAIMENGVRVTMPLSSGTRLNFPVSVAGEAWAEPCEARSDSSLRRFGTRASERAKNAIPPCGKPQGIAYSAVVKPLATKAGLAKKGQSIMCNFINTGVPHVVVETDNLETIDLQHVGPLLRRHKYFAPQGANVDYMRITGGHSLTVRTYERGVEAETLACGTGMTACAIIAALLDKVAPPVQVTCRHGDTLEVDFKRSGDNVEDITLLGPVAHVFQGEIFYP